MRSDSIIPGLRKKYSLLRGTETLLFGLGCGLMLWTLLFIFARQSEIPFVAGLLGTAIAVFLRAKSIGLLSLNDERIAFFLDRKFKQLNDSTDLVLRPHSSLTNLEEIQVKRTAAELDKLTKVNLPHQLPFSAICFMAGIVGAMVASSYLPRVTASDSTPPLLEVPVTTSEPEPVVIGSHELIIQPPAYTGLKQTRTQNLTARVPEGSDVTWQITFTGTANGAWLYFTNGDSLSLAFSDRIATASTRVSESTIYHIRWQSSGAVESSDYYELTAKPDEPPSVQIRNLAQFTRLSWGERDHIDVPVFLHDDFGLTQGHLIATVSKGSGESIKFREERLPFESPGKISGKDVNAKARLNFGALGMEPGDEVYFYAEAWDNRNPDRQRNRTETYFVSLQDTVTHVTTVDASLGVDLMPEYFRSQRQIIIDTEKLLKDQPKLSKQAFNSTSNELGYDQKVLRLKYGQFLGEEFETTIGEPAHETEEEGEEEEEDPKKKYGHQHDKDNEHNLVETKKPEAGHEHKEEGEEEDLTNAYRHDHDNMEEATFFTMSVRAKLKAALTLMWESELQLRLFAPRESLPVQYKILNLLREISQDSRIYVHRMGFDPPPLKEDRRLTGDLEEIGNPKATAMTTKGDEYPAIRAALTAIQTSLQSVPPLVDENLKSKLALAADEIAAASLERPGDYLIQLSQIRAIIDRTMEASDLPHALADIQSVCWNILPPEKEGPNQSEGTRHSLDEKLLEELKKPAND